MATEQTKETKNIILGVCGLEEILDRFHQFFYQMSKITNHVMPTK